MAFKIVIIQVKARNTIVCITVFTLFNDILFNWTFHFQPSH